MWCFETLAIGLLVAIVLAVVLQVVARYVLRISLPWPEELARFLLIWLTFAGAIVGTWHNAHFRVDFITRYLSPGVARLLATATDLLVCAALIVFIWQGIQLVEVAGFMRSTSMELSMSYVYGVLPVSGVFILGWFLRQAVRSARGAPEPASESPEL